MKILHWLRIVLFYVLLASSSMFWCILSVFVAPFLPFRARYRFVAQTWARCAVWLSWHVAGVRYRLRGAENVPARSCVIVANHQSTWETFFLTAYFEPVAQVLKRELLFVPFFGWAMALLKPIAIDRDNPKQALKQIAERGPGRLQQGAWVMVFPEGTRMLPGKLGKFTRSGAALAASAGVPLLPIAHNAGEFWPRHGWDKRRGYIDVVIGEPLVLEGEGPRAVADLSERARAWIAQAIPGLDG